MPWSTLVVNVTGAFAVGLLAAGLVGWGSRSPLMRLVGPGLLGGWSTWSTIMLDLHTLGGAGAVATAFAYLALTLLGGAAACLLGLVCGRRLPSRIDAGALGPGRRR